MTDTERPAPYPAPTASGADLGRIAFVIAAVAVLLAVVQQLLASFFPLLQQQYAWGATQAAGIFAAFGFLHTAISLGALVVGLIAAQRRRSPVLAGIAIGVGGAGVIVGIVALILVPLVGLAL